MSSTYPEWIFDGSPIADPLGHGERAVRFLRLLRHPKTRPRSAHLTSRPGRNASSGASMARAMLTAGASSAM